MMLWLRINGQFRQLKAVMLAAAISIASSTPCSASTMDGGYITDLSFGSDGWVWFGHTGTRTGSLPSCAEANGLWVVNGGTTQGQALVSGILAAFAKHQLVFIQGSSACDHGHETVQFIWMKGT